MWIEESRTCGRRCLGSRRHPMGQFRSVVAGRRFARRQAMVLFFIATGEVMGQAMRRVMGECRSLRAPKRMQGVQLVGLVLLGALATGCQSGTTVSNHRLIENQLRIDFAGLKSTADFPALHVTCSLPQNWRALIPQNSALYTHQQWKSPTGYTGCGVVFVHMPLPFSAKTLVWFAKLEYAKQSKDGKVVSEWTDDVGRPWFEGENAKYHVRGYVVVDGFSAWIVYFGYKVNRPINTAELGLAARSVQTVIPFTGDHEPATANLASASRRGE